MLIDSDRDLMSYTRIESRGIFLYIPLGALGYMIQLACKVNLLVNYFCDFLLLLFMNNIQQLVL